MCGVAGIISFKSKGADAVRPMLQRMTNTLMHRGPDGEGFWTNDSGAIALGHRRLKVIDLSSEAAQPMHYAGRYTITYNGEIYNYLELKEDLVLKRYIFKTRSDTEVILAAYDFWKEDCVNHFDGMFAFAIWDEDQQQLFCARDRFGEKPFYFFHNEERFLFASEMKAIWAAGVPRQVRNGQLLNYITLGFVHNVTQPDSTFFKDIFLLQPGHCLSLHISTGAMTVKSYWDIDKETINLGITEADAITKFSALLGRSVERRLRSDVAVGTSLSGGLDSSAIVALISSLQAKEPMFSGLQTFSAVFPGFEKDESNFIREVIRQFQVNNFQTMPAAGQLAKDFERLMYHQEEPFQSLSVYAQYRVYEMAREHGVTVILDGQGADETLAGYHKYYHWYWQELFAKKPAAAGVEVKAATKLDIDINWGIKNKIAAMMPGFTAAQLQKKAAKQQAAHPYISRDFFEANRESLSLTKPVVRKLNDILYFDTRQLGLQELLRYADRNSMAHGREVRLPFLDHKLVEFIFSLPSHYKIRQGRSKWILRKSMADKLPQQIVWRKDKVGFEPPQQQWLKDKKIGDMIMSAREQLVSHRILKPAVMNAPIQAKAAHQDKNDDFRYLCSGYLLGE